MKRRLFAVSLATCGFVNKIHAADNAGIQALAPHKPVKAPVFKILRLGTFQGGWSEAYAVNESGKAAGRVGFKIEGDYRPALFIPGQTPLPIYTDGPGEGTGINDRSEVVGWFRQGGFTQAFRWDRGGVRTLPSLGGGNSEADGINNRSETVGWSEAAPGAAHAMYWRGNQFSDLGTWGGYGARAVAINQRGDIVGFREVVVGGVGVRQGVRWIRGRRPQLMPIPSGYDCVVPTSINERGDVGGYMYPANNLLWGRVAFVYADNAYTLQPLSNDQPTVGLGINNRRDMVGFRFDQGADPRDRAMMWLRGQTPIGLDERPEFLAAGWVALGQATAINQAGTIVGWGFYARPTGGWNTEAFMIMTLS